MPSFSRRLTLLLSVLAPACAPVSPSLSARCPNAPLAAEAKRAGRDALVAALHERMKRIDPAYTPGTASAAPVTRR